MSEQLRTLNAVFGQRRRRMLAAAQSSTEAVERRNIANASQPEPPSRLPVRALGEYVPGGRVDAMRRLIGSRETLGLVLELLDAASDRVALDSWLDASEQGHSPAPSG